LYPKTRHSLRLRWPERRNLLGAQDDGDFARIHTVNSDVCSTADAHDIERFTFRTSLHSTTDPRTRATSMADLFNACD
jgi:hypothetical protein